MILPFASTLTTFVLLVVHSGVLPEETLAESVRVSPTVSASVEAESLIVGCFTVIVQVVDVPSTVAVILAVPCFTAVTMPFSSTTATLLLLERQVGVWPVDTEAVSCFVPSL